jgi:hypothetical protein
LGDHNTAEVGEAKPRPEFQDQIPESKLSKTFREAMTIVRHLGIEYM